MIDPSVITATSTGELYWDDGDSVITDITTHSYFYWKFSFTVNNNVATLTITPQKTMVIVFTSINL